MAELGGERWTMMTEERLTGLKPIEGQVLSLLARGYNATRMAEELHISRQYVYFLMRELRLRFLVLSNPALVSRAIGDGILQPDGTITLTTTSDSRNP
jgi:DNA-binding CsgD family transcriptional regulator